MPSALELILAGKIDQKEQNTEIDFTCFYGLYRLLYSIQSAVVFSRDAYKIKERFGAK